MVAQTENYPLAVASSDYENFADDAVSLNSQGIEVHQLSEDGFVEETSMPSMSKAARKKKKLASKRVNREPNMDKATVDPCKYKTKLCRNWMRDGYCSYESVCCYAHGEQDARTIHQNTQVLSSLGYFSELMLLAMEKETKVGTTVDASASKPKKPSQVEASLAHLARNSGAQLAQFQSNGRASMRMARPPMKEQINPRNKPPAPAIMPPALPQPMAHQPYTVRAPPFATHTAGQVPTPTPSYARPQQFAKAPRNLDAEYAPEQYAPYPSGVGYTADEYSYEQYAEEPPWKYPPTATPATVSQQLQYPGYHAAAMHLAVSPRGAGYSGYAPPPMHFKHRLGNQPDM